jgi:hypothetical protein
MGLQEEADCLGGPEPEYLSHVRETQATRGQVCLPKNGFLLRPWRILPPIPSRIVPNLGRWDTPSGRPASTRSLEHFHFSLGSVWGVSPCKREPIASMRLRYRVALAAGLVMSWR